VGSGQFFEEIFALLGQKITIFWLNIPIFCEKCAKFSKNSNFLGQGGGDFPNLSGGGAKFSV
jgi:hypothetical protein